MRVAFNATIIFDLDKDISLVDCEKHIIAFLEKKGIKGAYSAFRDISFILDFDGQIKKI